MNVKEIRTGLLVEQIFNGQVYLLNRENVPIYV